jgi:hypothetical protein
MISLAMPLKAKDTGAALMNCGRAPIILTILINDLILFYLSLLFFYEIF